MPCGSSAACESGGNFRDCSGAGRRRAAEVPRGERALVRPGSVPTPSLPAAGPQTPLESEFCPARVQELTIGRLQASPKRIPQKSPAAPRRVGRRCKGSSCRHPAHGKHATRLDGVHGGERAGAVLACEERQLADADAVFTGAGAANPVRGADDRGDDVARAGHLVCKRAKAAAWSPDALEVDSTTCHSALGSVEAGLGCGRGVMQCREQA